MKKTGKTLLWISLAGVVFLIGFYTGKSNRSYQVDASAETLKRWVTNPISDADYYQGFLPNAGNGKRVQRDVGEWINALRMMIELEPEIMIPSHGEIVRGKQKVQENIVVLKEALTYIFNHTIEGLNAGLRKDQIYQSVELPAYLKEHVSLEEKYVTAKDISKMIIRKYTGWWDDIPSNWSPAHLESQAKTIVELAGGIDELVAFSRNLSISDLPLASHFVDWAYYVDPENPNVQELVLEIYRKRILSDESVTQEMLVYLDHMVAVRKKMK